MWADYVQVVLPHLIANLIPILAFPVADFSKRAAISQCLAIPQQN